MISSGTYIIEISPNKVEFYLAEELNLHPHVLYRLTHKKNDLDLSNHTFLALKQW